MHSATLIVPGPLATRTGGYEYDRRIVAGLRDRGWSVDVRELSASFPTPTDSALRQMVDVLRAIPSGTTVVIDGLAVGAMPDHVERERTRLRIVALVHLPLAEEIGIAPSTARRLKASERRALAAVSRVVVTGTATIRMLASYGVGEDRLAVVEPGTDPAPFARGSGRPGVVHMVSVAALTPGKGHAILVRALARIPHRNWSLTCAGSVGRHPATVESLRALLSETGLEPHVSLVGELDGPAVAALYDSADLFVLATLRETYGMAVAEALARGLPVVSTTTGAIPDLVGGDAGILAAPGDVDSLADALTRVLADDRLRERLAAGAREVRERLPTWETAAAKMASVLEH